MTPDFQGCYKKSTLEILFYTNVFVCVPALVCVWMSEERESGRKGLRCIWREVIGGCELPKMSARNQISTPKKQQVSLIGKPSLQL